MESFSAAVTSPLSGILLLPTVTAPMRIELAIPANHCPPLRPFLKWAGGKRQLLPEILAHHLPPDFSEAIEDRQYFEPFIGAGAVLLALQPSRATIGDQNAELVNCYQVIRDRLPELVDALQEHRNEAEYYYKVRQWDRQDDFDRRDEVVRAARIIFLNKTCYNGLFRVNNQGQFNVPFGRYRNPKILDIEALTAIHDYLRSAQVHINQGDFQETVRSAQAGDFVYFDPPYDPLTATASFTGYGAGGFDRAAQTRLRDTFVELDQRGCRVLLSNSDTEFIRELYDGFAICSIDATRAINSNALKRGKVSEVLIKNYPSL
jgi:DNA adenine methylase